MKEFIEKLIKRLEELGWLEDTPLEEIIKEFTEEYKDKYVSKAVLEQIQWERDVAIEQLKELGYGLGEKVGWIPVSERLPEEKPFGDSEHTCSDDVLITVKHDRGTTVGMGCLTRGHWFYLKGTTEIDVIAWKPLPTPYKEGGE